MENPNDHRKYTKNLAAYFIIVFIIMSLMNLFLFPNFSNMGIQEVDYSEFLTQLENNEIKQVELEQYEIIWEHSDSVPDSPQMFNTARVEDPLLIERLNNAGVSFGQEIYRPTSPILLILINFIVPLLIFWAIGYYIMHRIRKRMPSGGSPLSLGDSGAKIYSDNEHRKSFDDVAGQDEAKESLIEVVDYLDQPEKYAKIGARPPKGILLVGPPGTGKTLMAQALAGEANVPFFSISGSDFVEMFVGRGAAKVRDLFKQASEKAPCIVFIDEIDTIGKKRDGVGAVGGNDEREQTLNQLLNEMDGFESNEGVIILAATNRPDSLDRALLRPGRFDRQVRMELPDLQGRIDILQVHINNYTHVEEVDLSLIARMTAGASGADLANIVNEAALRAVRENRYSITTLDMQEAVEVVIAGAERKNAILSDKEKEIVAYHEIGHALVSALQTDSPPVQKITIVPRTSGALGYTLQVEEGQKSLYSKQDLFNQLVTLAGGRAAEELVFGSITTGASNDIEKMTKTARAMIAQYGMSDKFDMMQIESQINPYLSNDTVGQVSAGMQEAVDQEVLSLIKLAHQTAAELLENNVEQLHTLSAYLLQEETISGEVFMELLAAE